MKFKRLSEEEVIDILKNIPKITNNARLKMGDFWKYINIEDGSESIWYGCFENRQITALCLMKRFPRWENGLWLMAEIQSVIKGYGSHLINKMLSIYKNIWWGVDPSQDKTLVDYYRKFDANEYFLEHSIWNDGNPQYFFYRCEYEECENYLLNVILKNANTEK